MLADKLILVKNKVNQKFNREFSLVFENNGFVTLEDLAYKRNCTHGRVITSRKLEDLYYLLQGWLHLTYLPY